MPVVIGAAKYPQGLVQAMQEKGPGSWPWMR